MRGGLDERIAFVHRLVHEPELAVLQVADAAVDHVAGCRGGAGGEVGALDEHDIHPLQREIAEGRDPIDPPTDDDDTRVLQFTQTAHAVT